MTKSSEAAEDWRLFAWKQTGISVLTLLTHVLHGSYQLLFQVLAVFGNLLTLLQKVLSGLLHGHCQDVSLLGAALLLTGRPFVAGVDQGGHLANDKRLKSFNRLNSVISCSHVGVVVVGSRCPDVIRSFICYSQKVMHTLCSRECTLNTPRLLHGKIFDLLKNLGMQMDTFSPTRCDTAKAKCVILESTTKWSDSVIACFKNK